jgi:uncharacterized protein YdaU (DUF1376 family)
MRCGDGFQDETVAAPSSYRAFARADRANALWFDPQGSTGGLVARRDDFVVWQRKARRMNRPWMPLHVGDYLGDTGHLITAQHRAYLLLMMHYWRKGELPDDDRQLCKIAKLPLKTWCEYRATLQDFLYEGWKRKRIEAELAKMMRVSEKRAIAGQKGGIGSALARMRLENDALSRRVPSEAIAGQASSGAAAGVDHSHPHQSPSKGEGCSVEPLKQQPAARAQRPAIPVSAELVAYAVRRTT